MQVLRQQPAGETEYIAISGHPGPHEAALRPEAVAVREALRRRGLETPIADSRLQAPEKRLRIQAHVSAILEILGLDLIDDSLLETPERIARMYVDEIFRGLDYGNFPKLTVVENTMRSNEMIRVSDISVSSTCEHHFVPIDGVATVAYIPKDKLIGLSKINRIVSFFSQRPQIQERLTEQVLLALQTLLRTQDVAVSIRATHFCVKARGIMHTNSRTTTTALGGAFKESAVTRKEFLQGAPAS